MAIPGRVFTGSRGIGSDKEHIWLAPEFAGFLGEPEAISEAPLGFSVLKSASLVAQLCFHQR